MSDTQVERELSAAVASTAARMYDEMGEMSAPYIVASRMHHKSP